MECKEKEDDIQQDKEQTYDYLEGKCTAYKVKVQKIGIHSR